MSFQIKVDNQRLKAAAERAPREIGDQVHRTVTGIALDAEGGVIKNTPVGATGHLRQSITHDISGSGIAIVGRVFSTDVPVKVASVEEGRKPGKMPPMAPIELWLRRKAGINSRSVAFLVARAIGRRGTKGAHMFQKGYGVARRESPKHMNGLRAAIARVLS